MSETSATTAMWMATKLSPEPKTVDQLRAIVKRLRKPIKWHYALSEGDQWQIDEDRSEAAAAIEDLFLGSVSAEEAAAGERERCIAVVRSETAAPAQRNSKDLWVEQIGQKLVAALSKASGTPQ